MVSAVTQSQGSDLVVGKLPGHFGPLPASCITRHLYVHVHRLRNDGFCRNNLRLQQRISPTISPVAPAQGAETRGLIHCEDKCIRPRICYYLPNEHQGKME